MSAQGADTSLVVLPKLLESLAAPLLPWRPCRAEVHSPAKMGDVIRQRLRELLDHEGVDPGAYNLDGEPHNECLILEVQPGGWCVYYSERGLRSGERHFETEDEACDEMARLLLADRGNRYVLVVGPLPLEEADLAFDSWLREHGFVRSELRPDDIRVDNPVLRAGEQSRRYWIHRLKVR